MDSTRNQMSRLFDRQFANIAEYDAFIQIFFDDVEDFVRMKADPDWRTKVMPDHENFADTTRSQMTIGIVQNLLVDGNLANYSLGGDTDEGRNSHVELPAYNAVAARI
ncbi:hypothetical protein N7488_010728 [Penicillium malachiteum]|nr:hypothetical protein N7488_010728 [Penicillium malachiteum]